MNIKNFLNALPGKILITTLDDQQTIKNALNEETNLQHLTTFKSEFYNLFISLIIQRQTHFVKYLYEHKDYKPLLTNISAVYPNSYILGTEVAWMIFKALLSAKTINLAQDFWETNGLQEHIASLPESEKFEIFSRAVSGSHISLAAAIQPSLLISNTFYAEKNININIYKLLERLKKIKISKKDYAKELNTLITYLESMQTTHLFPEGFDPKTIQSKRRKYQYDTINFTSLYNKCREADGNPRLQLNKAQSLVQPLVSNKSISNSFLYNLNIQNVNTAEKNINPLPEGILFDLARRNII